MRSSQRIALGTLWLWVCTAVLCSVAPAAAQPSMRGGRETTALSLTIGEQLVLPAQGIKTYSEGTKGIVDIRLTGDASRFVIVGVARGTTTLLCIMLDNSEQLYNLTVSDPSAAQAAPPPNNAITVAPQASIRLDLYFVQIDKNRTLGVGMTNTDKIGSLDLSTAFDVIANQYTQKTAAIISNFVPTLNLAQNRGWAKVSRHVALIASNGSEASFDSGGEFNVLRNTGLSQSIVSIKFGAQLSIKPRFDTTSGRIELTVKTELSDLSPGATDVPGRTLTNVQTVSNLALGESLAVAGLVSNNSSRSHSGLPFLSQIPIIGFLFGKVSEVSKEVENLLIIAPSVVEPLTHPRGRELLSNAMREFDKFHHMRDSTRLFPGKPWTLPDAPIGAQTVAP